MASSSGQTYGGFYLNNGTSTNFSFVQIISVSSGGGDWGDIDNGIFYFLINLIYFKKIDGDFDIIYSRPTKSPIILINNGFCNFTSYDGSNYGMSTLTNAIGLAGFFFLF